MVECHPPSEAAMQYVLLAPHYKNWAELFLTYLRRKPSETSFAHRNLYQFIVLVAIENYLSSLISIKILYKQIPFMSRFIFS